MLTESILQEPDLWESLKAAPFPVALYGTGNGADKIIDILNAKGINIVGVFASDDFKKDGKTFRGFPVQTLSELEKRYKRLTVLMCFGSSRPEVLENVSRIRSRHLFFAPDVPVYGETVFDRGFLRSNFDRLRAVYDSLADEISKKTFESIVRYKLSGDVGHLFSCESRIDETYKNILRLTADESYLDLGAYRGDTVFEFLRYSPGHKNIYAVEPDAKTFKKLLSATKNIDGIECINACVSDKSGTVKFAMNGSRGSSLSGGGTEILSLTADSIIGDRDVTYIKADVEGAECEFLRGAGRIISSKKPKMMISCYHKSEDMTDIPETVSGIRKDYKIYMRHFPCLPAWDTVYLFV